MTDIGLVAFSENKKIVPVKTKGLFGSFVPGVFLKLKELPHRCGFFRTAFGTRLYYLLKKKEFEQQDEIISLSGEFQFRIIKLPLSLDSLADFNKNSIEKILNKKLSARGINFCHIPAMVKEKGYFKSFEDCHSYDRMLLKMLLDPVLTNIYSKRSDRIGDMDILLLAGDNDAEVFEAVRILEPRIKYVTMASNNKEEVEKKAEEIFGDEGLSISVVSDCKSAMKNADLILNFDEKLPASSKMKVKADALIFNLADTDISGAFPENLVINGLVPDLPKHLAACLGRHILQFYSRKELAGLAISYITGLNPGSVLNDADSKRVMQDFELYGFRISGLKGRHGVFRLDALQKLAVCSS